MGDDEEGQGRGRRSRANPNHSANGRNIRPRQAMNRQSKSVGRKTCCVDRTKAVTVWPAGASLGLWRLANPVAPDPVIATA